MNKAGQVVLLKQFDAIIVGAGLAGLTCGLELADKGKKVLVLEAEPVVGGRTSSYVDRGMKVESGFHRFIGFYSAMPKILRKAGIKLDDIFMWEEKVEIRVQHKNKLIALGIAPLFGPVKVIKGMLGNNELLTPRDKISLISFFLAGFKDLLKNPQKLDTFNIQEYAKKHKVSEAAFYNVVVPLSTGLYFLPPERYSAYAFFGLMFPAVKRFYKMRIGAFLGGMTEVMCQPMAEAIEKRGSFVKTGHKVQKLLYQQNKIIGVELEDGRAFYGKQTVVATTLHTAKQLLKPLFPDHPWFQPMFELPMMPAATLQIELKKPALPKDITTFGPRTSMISFAEQSRSTFRHVPGRLSIILAAPDNFLTMTPGETLKHVLKDAEQLGINIENDIIDYRQINHDHDFYSLEPGNDWMRPEQKTPIPGLVLAGDYTRQPYFATMEGAVISGQKAAKIALQADRR